MVRFRKRGAREVVWGPEEPWVEPKREVILGPAGTPSDMTGAASSENASALGFLGEMASASQPSSSSLSSSTSGLSSPSEERPRSSPYGWEPSSSSSFNSSSNESNFSANSSDSIERIERLHRKLEYVSDKLEEMERKLRKFEDKLGVY